MSGGRATPINQRGRHFLESRPPMLNLQTAVVYDIETFPNAFTLTMRTLYGDVLGVWEISQYRDDRLALMQFFNWLAQTQTVMIGFNNIHFDYPVIHFIFYNPNATVGQIYEKAMSIIQGSLGDRFGHVIWDRDRFAPQIDLFKIHHFDNKAKSTSLKALQIAMRSRTVVDMPVEVGTHLTKDQIDNFLIPYNDHDVQETRKFAHFSMAALEFRLSLVAQFGVDVMNWPDTKIGSRMMEAKIGPELCYDFSTGRKSPRQTPRSRIALADIIFPYIQFQNPEFQRVLNYLKSQVLTAEEIKDIGEDAAPAGVQTKGVFKGLTAVVGGIEFHFGTGGIHGSVTARRIESNDDEEIHDVDVAALYPSIGIVNRLAPEHLGERFVQIYAELPKERKRLQAEKGKKSVEANTLKLASNGVYGNSNNKYSVFYDPKFTMTITVNGQLMLCMLAERLVAVPTLRIIQINTDGITYFINKAYQPTALAVCKEWEALTALTLEYARYSKMWIRDVNNYVAQSPDGTLKLKGAYWTPDPLNYHDSISAAQPSGWYKDLGNLVSTRAAVAAMVHGVDPELFIRMTTNPYDFVCRAKVGRADRLLWGGQDIQRTSRYYVSRNGQPLVKNSPPAGRPGAYKRANGVSEAEYDRVMAETGGRWDARVCTKNESVYETRETNFQAGRLTTVVNNISDFDFKNVDYDWYVNEARKLIIV